MTICDSCPNETVNGTTCESCLALSSAVPAIQEPLIQAHKSVNSQAELFRQYLADETLRIDSLDWESDYQAAYHELSAKIAEYEAIAFEVKKAAVKAFSIKRNKEFKAGQTFTAETVEKSKAAWTAKTKEKKKKLTKLEGIVKNQLLLGATNSQILDYIPASFGAPSEIRIIIENMKSELENEK